MVLTQYEAPATPATVPVFATRTLGARLLILQLLVLTQSCWCQALWPVAAVPTILQAIPICPEAQYY